MKNNEENREKLSQSVVDSWDMDTLIGHAIDELNKFYEADNEEFEEDWETMFGKEEG